MAVVWLEWQAYSDW